MKITAVIILFLFSFPFFSKSSEASVRNYVNAKSAGDDSQVYVNIENNVNSKSSQTSVYEKNNTSTNVEISQSGEGKSEVSINGETWKLEGPGEISVNKESGSDASGDTNVSTPSPSVSPIPETERIDELKEENKTFFESLRTRFKEIFSNILTSFSSIF